MVICNFSITPIKQILVFACVYSFMFTFLSCCTGILSSCAAKSSNFVDMLTVDMFFFFLDFLGIHWGTPSATAPLFTLANTCWCSGAPNNPLPTIRRLKRSYGGDGEAVGQVLSSRREYAGISSLSNRMHELSALTRLQLEYRECSIMRFTES